VSHRRSLYNLLAVLISTVVLLVLGTHALWMEGSHRNRVEKAVRAEAEANLASLSRNLTPFMEAYAVHEYEKLLANEIELRPHFAIIVSDKRMARVLGQEEFLTGKVVTQGEVRDFDPNDEAIQQRLRASLHAGQSAIVSAEGETLGSVAVYTDDTVLRQQLRTILLSEGISTLAVALAMIGMLLALIHRVVVRPLRDVADAIGQTDADGIPRAPVPMLSYHEVGRLSEATNAMLAEIRSTRDKLKQSAEVFEHANDGIMITDADAHVLDVNAAFTRITGYSRAEVLGRTPSLLRSGRHDQAFYQAMRADLREKGVWNGEIWNRRKDGVVFPEMLTISAVRDESGRIQRYVALFADITQLKNQQSELEHIAHYDALTHLPNRVLLADRLKQAMQSAERRGTRVAVLFLDLDNFKTVNDQHGHEAGDELLLQLAERMGHALRQGDTIARLGGDEFVAVLQDLQNQEDIQPYAERLLQAAQLPVCLGPLELRVSASVGVALYPQSEPIDPDQLLRQADQAMYQAKQSGKNRYHVFDADQDRATRGLHESVERIREALNNHEFELFYQPKVNMRTGKVLGAEALIRWHHPQRGLLSPGTFLPIISGHALNIDIGRWVLKTALAQMDAWRKQGARFQISVNIEAIHLQQPQFVAELREAIGVHAGLAPGELELEVLETAALEDVAQVSALMRASQQLGVSFSLDDFGTGYSSLTYLKRLPAEVLKIDQSFVRDMLDDPDDLAILAGVLGLAQTFGRKAIAEGVETKAHVELLLRIGCDLGQGYAIARPMPAEQLLEWVANWRPDPAWALCQRVSPLGQAVLIATVEHNAWMTQLRRYLQVQEQHLPELDHERCRFSQWLEQSGAETYRHQPAIGRIALLHKEIHDRAHQMLRVHREGDTAGALVLLQELQGLKDELVEQMHDLTIRIDSQA
jgi:diguanylate cyclase (GGDEF)-like protein/PAS domain S-box-containing protein